LSPAADTIGIAGCVAHLCNRNIATLIKHYLNYLEEE